MRESLTAAILPYPGFLVPSIGRTVYNAPVRRAVLLSGFALLLLAGCDSKAASRWSPALPWMNAGAGSSSSVTTVDLRIPASPSSSEAPDEPTFADEVMSGSGALSTAPKTVSGALLERALSGGILETGLPTAPVLRVYTHPSCAYCREFEEEQRDRLLKDFVAGGRLRIQTVIVPLKKYPSSALQASALVCAAEQGRGEDMLSALFANDTMEAKTLPKLGKSLQLGKTFDACVASPATANTVAWQAGLAARENVTLVPSFDLNGKKKTGLPGYPDLRGWIDASLSGRE